ncbi:MAG: hypothetical protein IJO57_02650, partial [Bacilli bacterium]|nr:hypothetical protein [Bacilli bacterium]
MKFQVAENVNDLITQLDSGKIKSGLLWTEEELESYGLDVSGIMDSDNNGLYRVYYDNGKLRIQSDVDNSSLNIRMYNDGSYDMHNPSSGVTKAFYDNQVRFSYPDSSSKYVYDNGGYTIYDKDLNIIGKGYPNGSYEEYGEDYTKYYDVEGNLQRVDYSDGSYQIYNSGKLMTVRYPDGSYSSYDQSERLVRRKMGDYFERYDYDEDGNYTIFDENNNILEKRYINGSYEEYGEDYIKYYDVEGNLQMVNYSDGRYEEYFSNGDYAKYDKYGQYIMIGNSLSGFYSEYKYDSSGRLESIIDSDGKYTRYDADRNIIGRGYPDGRYEEYSEDYTKYYDVEGNLQRVDYSDRRYEEYGEDYIKYYDVEGNLQRVDYSDGRYEE